MTLSARLGGFASQNDNAQVTAELRNPAGATLATLAPGPGHRGGAQRPDDAAQAYRVGRRAGRGPDGVDDDHPHSLGGQLQRRLRRQRVAALRPGDGPEAGQTGEACDGQRQGPRPAAAQRRLRRPRRQRVRSRSARSSTPRNGHGEAHGRRGGRQDADRDVQRRHLQVHPGSREGRRQAAADRAAGAAWAATSPRVRTRADAGAARRRTVRYLNAKASGRFSVVGKYSKGVERGTTWTTTDRCDGTLTAVTAGAVRSSTSSASGRSWCAPGKSYLARARR